MPIKDLITESELVGMFMDKLYRCKITCDEHGTYNKMDPTAFQNIKAEVFLEYGYTVTPDEGCEEYPPMPDPPPDYEIVKVEVNDCTWGITFKFHTSKGTEEGYFNRPDKWCRTTDNFFKVMKDLFMHGGNPDDWKRFIEGNEIEDYPYYE